MSKCVMTLRLKFVRTIDPAVDLGGTPLAPERILTAQHLSDLPYIPNVHEKIEYCFGLFCVVSDRYLRMADGLVMLSLEGTVTLPTSEYVQVSDHVRDVLPQVGWRITADIGKELAHLRGQADRAT